MGQNESYYDEYYAEAQETIPVGLDDIPVPGSFKTADLLRLGATLVAFPIVIGALHKGMGRIGPTLSRGLASGIAKSLRPTSLYTRSFSRLKGAGSGPGPTLSQTVESMPKDHFLNILRSRMTNKTTSMTQEYMEWKARSAQLMAQRRSGGISPVRARAIRSQEFFRKLSEPSFVKSGMARHAQQYMKRSFVFYGAARIIGGVEGHDDGPSIFNPVGMGLDFMKFTLGFYPIDLALLGGGKIISQSFHRGAGGLQSVLGRNKDNLRKYMARHAAGATKWREKLAASAYGSRGAWRKYKEQVKWRDLPPHKSVGMVGQYGLAQTGKLLKAGWDQGVAERRRVIGERRNEPYLTEALRMASGVLDKASKAVGQTSSNFSSAPVEDRKMIRDLLMGEFKKASEWKPSFFEDIMGLERAKLAETTRRHVAEKMVKVWGLGKAGESQEQFYQMYTKNMYNDKMVYNLGDGKSLDLSPFNPKSGIAKIYRKVRQSRAGGMGLGWLDAIGRLGLDKGVSAHYFDNREAYNVGLSGRLKEVYGAELGEATKAELNAYKLFSPELKSETDRGLFLFGRHFLLQPNKVTAVTPAGVKFRMIPKPQGAAFERILGLHGGYPKPKPMSGDDVAYKLGWMTGALGKARRFLHNKILRPLEFGTGLGESESIFSHMKGIAMKYTSPHSPLHLTSEESLIFNDKFLAHLSSKNMSTDMEKQALQNTVSALRTIQNVIGRASVNASDVVYRKVDLFRELLDINIGMAGQTFESAAKGGAGTINIAKALEDNHYLWKTLQDANLNAKVFGKNKHVTTAINDIQGQSFEYFLRRMSAPSSSGYGGLSISKMEEVKHFFIEEALTSADLLSHARYAEFNKIAKGASGKILGGLNKNEVDLLEIFSIKRSIKNSLAKGISSQPGTADYKSDITEAVRAVVTQKARLHNIAYGQFGGLAGAFSSGHMPKELFENPYAEITDRMRNSPFVSIPDNLVIPGRSGLSQMWYSFFPKTPDGVPTPEAEMSRLGMFPLHVMDRVARVGETIGFAPNPETRRSALRMMGTITKWGVAASTIGLIWGTADTLADTSPLFKGTMLDEGLTVAGAEQLVQARLALGGIQDATGLTQLMQYSEGLMPGSVSSQGARLTRLFAPMTAMPVIGMRVGGFKGAATGAVAGMMMGMAGFITDERDREQLIEEYSGRKEVAVRKGRWWELSRQPFQGRNIQYFRANWFARLKSQHMNTPDNYGSKMESMLFKNPPMGFNPLGALIDPYHYERKHYLSRPYPETGGLGNEIPIVGPVVSFATSHAPKIGPFQLPMTKPALRMHSKEMARSFNTYSENAGGVIPGYASPEYLDKYQQKRDVFKNSPGSAAARGLSPISQNSVAATLGALEYKVGIELPGLYGFGWESFAGRILKGGESKAGLLQPESVLASARELNSYRKEYWDLNLGGLMGTTEFIRRLIPRKQYSTKYYNEIPNRMAQWLNAGDRGIDFTVGDPYNKIPEGSMRLPGRGYESIHNVKRDFPARASMMGKSTAELVERLLNMQPPLDDDAFDITTAGTYLHRVIQNQLARQNILVEAERMIYDSRGNISGHIDAIIKNNGRNEVLEIKTISGDALATISAPRSRHYSQVNFYMRATGMKKGSIMYVSRNDPTQTRTFEVHYSENRYQEDFEKLRQARAIAATMANEDLGYAGSGYSHLDKLAILADVAPYSNSYKETLKIVRQRVRAGMLDAVEQEKYQTIMFQRSEKARRVDLYPYRFQLADLMTPSEIYPTGLNPNEYIKPAAEYPLPMRALGSVWEGFCVPGSELIETDRGYIQADHIMENDLVRTHLGEWKAVTQIHKRRPVPDDKMMIIYAGGHDIPLRVTKGHQIWTEKGMVSARSVNREDTLLYPAISFEPTSYPIDLLEMSNGAKEIIIDDKPYVRRNNSNKIHPRYIEKTQALMRLMGYYIARGGTIRGDGSTYGFRIGFNNRDLAVDALSLLFDLNVPSTQQEINGYNYVKFRSPVIASFFEIHFGSGQDKKIPDFIFNSEDVLLKAFLKGLMMNSTKKSLCKESPELLMQISKILLHFKIPHCIKKEANKQYVLEMGSEDMTFTPDGVCHMAVTSSRIDYHLPAWLYDFTVYEHHTYCTGLYAIHNSHLDSPIHTRLLNYRSPMEDYERSRLYGRDASFWEHPWRDFIQPWMTSAAASDTALQGAMHGGFWGAFAGPPGALIGAFAGGIAGGTRGVSQKVSGDRWIPGHIQDERQMDRYFDKLQYLKAQKLYKLTGQEEYRQAMGETMTGLNPLGMNATSWVSMFRSLPHAERRYFNAFLQTSDPDKREEITESISPEVAELLRIKWAQQEGGEDKQALSDFRSSQDVSQFIRDEGIPGADWMGWAPAVRIEDVKMISAKHEGWDAHDFGLGWRDQVRRMEQSPFNPGPIQMTHLSKYDINEMSPSVAVDKNTLITAINKVLASEGIVGNVTIDQIPGGVGAATGTGAIPSQVEIRVKRKQLSGNTQLYNLSALQRASLNG